MLKTTHVYLVSVTLNDGRAFCCTLLSKPEAAILVAVASAQKTHPEFGRVLALADNIAIPAVGESDESDIAIGGIIIGMVRVETQTVYGFPVKRPRQPKTDTPADTNKPKRGRKPRATAPADAPVDAPVVTSDTVIA